MKYLFCLIFIFACFFSDAQPPGYLGKRFTLSYEQLTGINYFNFLIGKSYYIDQQIDETNANFNYIGSLTIDYVVGKSKSRGLSFSPINQTMYFSDHRHLPTNYAYFREERFINHAKLTGFTVGLYVKYFNRDRIAPLGEYFKFEFLYSTYSVKNFDKEEEIYKLTKSIDPFSSLGFNVTFGKNRIFWNKLVVSTGISCGLRLNFFSSIMDFGEINSDNDHAVRVLKNSADFWHGQNLFYNLHIGVGWLMF